jgi:HSP20 family molecular chaperone IbpA
MTTNTSITQSFQETEGPERASAKIVFRPQVDIIDTADAILLVADMPGVAEAGADVSLEKNVLTIRGTAAPQQFEGYAKSYSEYRVGDFERVFTISSEIDRDGIEATLKNGVLRVVLPKARQQATQKVVVQAG